MDELTKLRNLKDVAEARRAVMEIVKLAPQFMRGSDEDVTLGQLDEMSRATSAVAFLCRVVTIRCAENLTKDDGTQSN